ncbi:MAG TPA: chlorophyllase [Actinoplanes sp.]
MRGRTATTLVVVTLVISACSPNVRDTPPANTASPSPLSSAPATSPTRAPVTPPAGTAPAATFPIRERTVRFSRGTDRPLATTVWYPDAPGPFPLVLFSHGLTSEPSAYAALLTAWARAGFVVAAPAYPHTSHDAADYDAVDVVNQPVDAAYVITRMIALNAAASDPLAGRINTARIAAAGHSAGGITTIGMFSGNRDDRLVAGIVLAGRQVFAVPFAGPPAPLLFVHGKLDKTVPYADGLAAYRTVPWSRAMMAVTEGGHVAITKDFGPVIATTTDFLRWSLYGDAAARGRLRADATASGAATWTDDL